MHRRGFLGLAVALGTAALTEGCVTISPLATDGDFPVDASFQLPLSQTWTRMKQRSGGSGQIVIGVKADQPGLGYFNAGTNSYSGFDILMARMVAAGLGFGPSQIQFSTVASQDRETELENGTVDLIIASYSYTAKRAALVDFAGPYFSTPEALLVARNNHSITGIDSVTASTRLCEVTNSTTVNGITLQNPVTRDTYGECVDALESGGADVVYSDYALLLGYAVQEPGHAETDQHQRLDAVLRHRPPARRLRPAVGDQRAAEQGDRQRHLARHLQLDTRARGIEGRPTQGRQLAFVLRLRTRRGGWSFVKAGPQTEN
jgi:glutamate transport system substrate-binding protein